MTKQPPIPPANRSPKGAGSAPDQDHDQRRPETEARKINPDEQGQQGNTKQNTTHQGHQQDR